MTVPLADAPLSPTAPTARLLTGYRPEVDGLRALAVLPVIAFHAGFAGFDGGFIGVDVFFVISGYLITGILVSDLQSDRYSITRFYERRARRILPALFVVLAASIIAAQIILPPPPFMEFSASVFSVVLFLSNMLFIAEVDYFGPAAEETPLLHTWSLAVEEQFYILFPLILWGLWQLWKRPALIWGVGLITLASLVFSEWAWRLYPAQTFFFLPSRAWELGAGALCALRPIRAPATPKLWHQTLGLLGIVAIVMSIIMLDRSTPFPSLWALLPVGGSVAVILWATTGTVAARLLSLRAVVGIGLISYSAYLWHNPMFAFARLAVEGEPSTLLMLGLALLSLVLAALSWRFVEQPFRHHKTRATWLPRRWQVFAVSGLGIAVFAGFGLWGFLTDGRASLWLKGADPQMRQTYVLMQSARDIERRSDDGACRFNIETLTPETATRLADCQTAFGPGIAVLGDSHAIDLAEALLLATQTPFLFALTDGGCRPDSRPLRCDFEGFAQLVTAQPGLFQRVVFETAGQHLLYMEGGREAEALFQLTPPDGAMPIDQISIRRERLALIADYASRLAQSVPVFWLTPRIEHHLDDAYIMARGCGYAFALRGGQEALFQRLAGAIADTPVGPGVTIVDQNTAAQISFPEDFMTCDAMYWIDGDHLSQSGRARIGPRLAPYVLPPSAR